MIAVDHSLANAFSFGINAGPDPESLGNFEALTDAILDGKEITFAYQKLHGAEQRHVRPLALAAVQGGWYLLAHDLHRRLEERWFLLQRMANIVETGSRFERPVGFSVERSLASGIGVFGGTPVRVILQIKGVGARLVRERRWHPSQQLRDLPDGAVELELHVAETPELVSWVLARGSDAQVIEPKSLRQKVRQEADAIARASQEADYE